MKSQQCRVVGGDRTRRVRIHIGAANPAQTGEDCAGSCVRDTAHCRLRISRTRYALFYTRDAMFFFFFFQRECTERGEKRKK